jgi:TatD DNase family protein
MLIDSHVNLHAPQFDADRELVLARARSAGIGLMVNICDRVSSFTKAYALAEGNDDIWATIGTHPHEAKDNPPLTEVSLRELATMPKVVGIGETGLDYHYDLSPREVQVQIFRVHIDAARRADLPLIVHSREADAVMGDILEEEHARAPFRILMHCYTSGAELARRVAALGAWFSVSGIATFKTAGEVRAVIAEMPADRIIVETDCPYLAPVPMRGRRNEPAYLPFVLEELARVRGWTATETEERTEGNFFNLFDRIPRPVATSA